MTTTDTTEATAPATSATDTDEQPPTGTGHPDERENGSQAENDGEGGESDEPRGRAGRYRERAQAAEGRVTELEAQSAELTATVERLQKLHVENVVTAAGVKPRAVFAVAELGDLLDDAGLPDEGKVKAAIDAARDQLGVGRSAPPLRSLGMRSGAGAPPPQRNDWAAAFGPRSE